MPPLQMCRCKGRVSWGSASSHRLGSPRVPNRSWVLDFVEDQRDRETVEEKIRVISFHAKILAPLKPVVEELQAKIQPAQQDIDAAN